VSRGAFIAWAVGRSRNRTNWHLTTVKRLRNVLAIITTMALERRDITTVDPGRNKIVFESYVYCADSHHDDDLGSPRYYHGVLESYAPRAYTSW